ncbi:MAG: sigma-70 family RNA polymerase sigma factor [Clostridiales bacterium]|nr:sigma-70 family RNA polymerase sigma factor [Clostridiales bacterium]
MDKHEFSMRVIACENRLYRISTAILGNTFDRDDAVQETLLKAWANLSTLREEKHFETWLIRILINECRTVIRKRRPFLPLPDVIAAPEPPDPRLFEALLTLDVKYRLPIVLHHVEDYTIHETARILQLPSGTVKWRIEYGKKLLRELLRREEER